VSRRCRRASAGVLASRASPTILLPSRRSCVDTQQDPPVQSGRSHEVFPGRRGELGKLDSWSMRRVCVTTRPSSVLAASSVAKDDSGRDTEQPAENNSREDDNENDKQANNETNKPAHAYSGRDVRAERAVPGVSRTTLRTGPPCAGCVSMLVLRRFGSSSADRWAWRNSRYGSAALTACAAISRCSDRSVGPRGGRRRRERSVLGGCRRVQLRQGRT
jgi:hypothetical protein